MPLDEMYHRLIDCNFGLEEPELALGSEAHGDRPTEVVLRLAFGEFGTAESGRYRLTRWRRGEMSGHDLAREPGLGEQRDYRLGEMPLPVRPVQPLIGAKRSRDGPSPSHSAGSPTAAPPMQKVRMKEIQIQTAENSETLERKEKDWEQLCKRLNEIQEKAKNCDEWKRKYEELQILFKEEEIKHLKELYNARVSKLSPDVLEMMHTETTAKSKTQELYRPSEVTAPQRVSSPPNARNTIHDPSETYLAPQFQENFEQVAKAVMQKINRARDRGLGRIVPTQRAGQSHIRKEKSTENPTEPAGPVPSGAKVRPRVDDIRKDLNTRRNSVQVAAEHSRACLNGVTWNPAAIHQPVPAGSQHLIIGDSLVRDLNDNLVGGQTTVISIGGASVAQVIKMMQLQNDDCREF